MQVSATPKTPPFTFPSCLKLDECVLSPPPRAGNSFFCSQSSRLRQNWEHKAEATERGAIDFTAVLHNVVFFKMLKYNNRLIVNYSHSYKLKVKWLPKALLGVEFRQVQLILEQFWGMKEFNSKEGLYELWGTQNPITLTFLLGKEK